MSQFHSDSKTQWLQSHSHSRVEGSNTDYHLEFTFDSDVDCCFTIYNFLPDTADLEILKNGLVSTYNTAQLFHLQFGIR